MRPILLSLFLLLTSCAHKVWVVPVESGVCESACNKAREGCEYGSSSTSVKLACIDDHDECLSKCPGAHQEDRRACL